MKKKLPIQVVLAILTTITVVFWVGFSVYSAFVTDAPDQVSEEILKPLSPELNLQTLAEVEKRLYFDKGTTVAFSSQSAIIKIEEETEVPRTGTASSDLESTQSAELLP